MSTTYPFALYRLLQGFKDNFDIPQEGDVIDVLYIIFEFLFPGNGITAIDLGQTTESRTHIMAMFLFRIVSGQISHQQGSRPYHGHVALEDVEEFGELVEAGAAQEPAVGGQAHVVGEQFPAGVALVCHGAELDELEYLFALPGPWLREEGVPAHLDGPNQRKENEQRAQAAQGRKRAAEVQDSFEAAWVHDTNIGYSRTGNEQITRKMSKNLHARRPQNEARGPFFVKKAALTKFFGQKCA